MELSSSWEADNHAATQELPTIYGTRRFIAVFISALHWSLSWARSIQSMPPHPISLRSIFTLYTQLRVFFLVVSFLLAFPPISYIHSSSPIRATFPVHLILLALVKLILLGQELNYSVPHYAVFFNLLSLQLYSVQIFSSAPCPQKPSVYVPHLFP
jgi:hypothetical protein